MPTRIMRSKNNIAIGRKIPQVNLFPRKMVLKDPVSIPKIWQKRQDAPTHRLCISAANAASFPARADIVVLATPRTYLQ